MPEEVDFEYALFLELSNIRKYIKRRFDAVQFQIEKLSEDVIGVHQLIGHMQRRENSFQHEETLPFLKSKHSDPELLSSTKVQGCKKDDAIFTGNSKNYKNDRKKHSKHLSRSRDRQDENIGKHESDSDYHESLCSKPGKENKRRQLQYDKVSATKRRKLKTKTAPNNEHKTETLEISSEDESIKSTASKSLSRPKSKPSRSNTFPNKTESLQKSFHAEPKKPSAMSSNQEKGDNPFAYPAWKPPKNRKTQLSDKRSQSSSKGSNRFQKLRKEEEIFDWDESEESGREIEGRTSKELNKRRLVRGTSVPETPQTVQGVDGATRNNDPTEQMNNSSSPVKRRLKKKKDMSGLLSPIRESEYSQKKVIATSSDDSDLMRTVQGSDSSE